MALALGGCSFLLKQLRDFLDADFSLRMPFPSTSPIGAASACAKTCAGNTAYHRLGTLTTFGYSTFSGTWPRTARRVWFSPTARCPPATPPLVMIASCID